VRENLHCVLGALERFCQNLWKVLGSVEGPVPFPLAESTLEFPKGDLDDCYGKCREYDTVMVSS
jgi:hypothetical protein